MKRVSRLVGRERCRRSLASGPDRDPRAAVVKVCQLFGGYEFNCIAMKKLPECVSAPEKSVALALVNYLGQGVVDQKARDVGIQELETFSLSSTQHRYDAAVGTYLYRKRRG